MDKAELLRLLTEDADVRELLGHAVAAHLEAVTASVLQEVRWQIRHGELPQLLP